MVREVHDLIRLLEQDHWAVREEAARALAEEVDGEALNYEELAKMTVPRIGRRIEESNWRVRRAAAAALGHLSDSEVWGRKPGTAARGAVPELAKRLASEDLHVRRAAKEPFEMLRAEGKLGDVGAAAAAALPDLLKRLQDEDWMARESAAKALAAVGVGAAPALPELARRVADDSDKVRHAARGTIERLGADGAAPDVAGACASAVPDLVERLYSENWCVRCAAAWALGVCGNSAAVAGPALVQALTDGSRAMRESAVEALGNLGLAATPALPEMGHRLGDNEECVRVAARDAIEKVHKALSSRDYSKHESASASRCLRKLKDPDQAERIGAAQGLAKLGVEALPAVPGLAGALLDDVPLVSEAAGKALAQLREVGAIGSLGDDGDIDRPPPVSLHAKLAEILDEDEPRWEVRLAAAEALANLALKAARVVQPLARRMRSGEAAYVEAAKELVNRMSEQSALLDIFGAADEAAPHLVERYASDDPLVSGLASEALRKLHAAGLLDDLPNRLRELEEFMAGALQLGPKE